MNSYAKARMLRKTSSDLATSMMHEFGTKGPHSGNAPFLRWDEKASLQRDAIRSQWSTRSKRNEKETGYEKD